MSVYVVDTGVDEVYVLASDECDAGEHVSAVIGGPINYVEWFSDDAEDAPYELLVAS